MDDDEVECLLANLIFEVQLLELKQINKMLSCNLLKLIKQSFL